LRKRQFDKGNKDKKQNCFFHFKVGIYSINNFVKIKKSRKKTTMLTIAFR